MDPRPVDQWIQILGNLPSPNGESAEKIMAERIIGDLVGYKFKSRQRSRDEQELANAMIAYARMMFDAQVRP